MATAIDLIKALISGEYNGEDVDYSDVNSSFLSNFDIEKEDLWQNLLDFMNEEKAIDKLQHIPMLQSDFPISNLTSLFEFINNNADLSDDILWDLKAQFMAKGIDLSKASGLKGDTQSYFWNESMSKALAIFLNYFDLNFQSYRLVEMIEEPSDWDATYTFYYIKEQDNFIPNEDPVWHSDVDYYLPDDSLGYLSTKYLKKADAGYSFISEPWVMPWYNIDGATYSVVRGSDQIQSVLKNSNQLQYTREKDNAWLRLLMPKYLRKVEVEDLNRNFWVISTALGAICNFLFNDNTPFKRLFESIIKELVQLWENILYLWATLALLSQKDAITEVHSEVLPISNNEFQNYIKFDNFDKPVLDLENLLPRVQYIIDAYSAYNICIALQVRDNNYKHNYYSTEIYPGFIFYNRNTKTASFLPIEKQGEFQIEINAADMFLNEYKDKVGTLKENETTYEYLTPVTTAAYQNEPYYIILRTEPQLTASYSNDRIQIDSFFVRVYDVATILKDNPLQPSHIKLYMKPNGQTWTSEDAEALQSVEADEGTNLHSLTPIHETFDIEKGFYLGELASYCCALDAPTWQVRVLFTSTIPFITDNLIAIEQAFEAGDTTGITFDTDPDDQIEDSTNIDSSIQNDKDIVKISTLNNYSSSSEFVLFRSNHLSALSGDSQNTWKYNTLVHYANSTAPEDWLDEDVNYYYKDLNNQYILANGEGGSFVPNEDYYKVEQTDTTSPLDAYSQSAAAYAHGAVLCNPITEQQVSYPNYQFMRQFIEWYDAPNDLNSDVIVENYSEVYLTDGSRVMNNNNWIFRFTEVTFATLPASVSDQNYEIFFSGITKTINDVSYNTIVQRITTHLFYADGTYARRVYDRAQEYTGRMAKMAEQQIAHNDLSNIWSLLYNNKVQYETFLSLKNSYTCLKKFNKDFDTYLNTGNNASEANLDMFHPKYIVEEGA